MTPSTPAIDQASWNKEYRAALPPQLQALLDIPVIQLRPDGTEDKTKPSRVGQATVLATQGFILLPDIFVRGGDPATVMRMRWDDGYRWMHSWLQDDSKQLPPFPAGVVTAPGLEPYDPNNPPHGAALITLDPVLAASSTTVPPYQVPAAVVAPPPVDDKASVVGKEYPDVNPATKRAMFEALPKSSKYSAGYVYEDDPRGKFILMTSFGRWWELMNA